MLKYKQLTLQSNDFPENSLYSITHWGSLFKASKFNEPLKALLLTANISEFRFWWSVYEKPQHSIILALNWRSKRFYCFFISQAFTVFPQNQQNPPRFSAWYIFLPQIFSSDAASELLEETSLKEIGNADDFYRLGPCPGHHMSTDMFWMVFDDFQLTFFGTITKTDRQEENQVLCLVTWNECFYGLLPNISSFYWGNVARAYVQKANEKGLNSNFVDSFKKKIHHQTMPHCLNDSMENFHTFMSVLV